MANLASRRFRNLRKSIGPTQGKPWASPSHERKSISHIPLTRKLGSVLLPLFPVKLFHCWVPPAQIPAPPRCLLLFLLLRGSWSLSGSSFPWQGSLPSSPWLQVLLTFKPLSGSAEWMVYRGPASVWISVSLSYILVQGSYPTSLPKSDFSNNLSISRPASLVKSLCRHKPQADLFESLCNSCFPPACQATLKDPRSVSGFLCTSLFPPGACPALTNLLKCAQILPISSKLNRQILSEDM